MLKNIIIAMTKSRQISLTTTVIKGIVEDGAPNSSPNLFSEWVTLVMDSSQIIHNMPSRQLYRTQHPQIALIYEGEGTYTINYDKITLKKGTLLTLPVGTIFSAKSRSGNLKMRILDFDIPTSTRPDFFIYNLGVIELGSDDYQRIQTFFMLLNQSMKKRRKREKSINCIIHALLYDISSIALETSKSVLMNHSKKELLYFKFISSLIRDQECMARTVSHYAKLLEVSADYLNIAVKETSGFTAMEWINKVTIDMSEMLLNEKKMSISEVGHKMGFVEQPSFSRFFKKETGMTPMEYRNGKEISLGEAQGE